ncbi:colipase-like [Centruroides sculpturatus]|uniref:colipase-like n=1 Tax=Centruroides sculpturatus TaxID=218467 RepID=UPI000C6D167A|nr:colipase-like [Centruroides sculpturatus]
METTYCVLILSLCLICQVTSQEEYLEQRMIDPFTGWIIPYKRDLSDGHPCINSVECSSGCCLRSNKGRKCAGKSLKGHKCSKFALKGEIYKDYCPCLAGESACSVTKGKNRFLICSF